MTKANIMILESKAHGPSFRGMYKGLGKSLLGLMGVILSDHVGKMSPSLVMMVGYF